MNSKRFPALRAILVLLICSPVLPAFCATFHQISALDGSQPFPVGGGGESWTPVISADGRFVLFASTANNLVTNVSGNSIPLLNLPRLNVYLRDRTNGTTALVSVNLSGTGGGNGDSFPSQISTNGRYALFESTAGDLVPNDTNGVADVFLRDLVSGTTYLVSTNLSGGAANGSSRSSAMTPDGRFVAFVSAATNLVAGDTNRIADVFVRDLQSATTILVSTGAVSTNFSLLSSSSEAPDITPDGRYVAFFSTATNLVSAARSGGEVYVRDIIAGTTTWASVDARTLLGVTNAVSCSQVISADGNFVAYEASARPQSSSAQTGIIARYNIAAGVTDLVDSNGHAPLVAYEDVRNVVMTPDGRFLAYVANVNGTTAGTNTCIKLWDAQTGTKTLVSADPIGNVPAGTCSWPVIDPNGRYVAFQSSAEGLVTNTLSGDYHLYVRDTQGGTTTLVATDVNGIGVGLNPTTMPAMSSDARFVAFESPDASLVANDRNRAFDVFLRDLAVNPVELISAAHPLLPSVTPNGPSTLSRGAVSADGRFVAFASESDNLVANDTNAYRDIFVRDRVLGTNILVSVSTNGGPGNYGSTEASISTDGHYVAFTSAADDVGPGHINGLADVFVRDLQAGSTRLVSVNSSGGNGNAASYSPAVGNGGRFVLFRSKATNLAAGTYAANSENLFLNDAQTGTTFALTTNGVVYSAMTPDGHFVAYATSTRLAIWDSLTASDVYSLSAGITGLGLSPNGNRLVYWTGSVPGTLHAVDRGASSDTAVATLYLAQQPVIPFSLDNRFAAYMAKSNSTSPSQIYLYDFQNGLSTLVSRHLNMGVAVNSNCDSPTISGDGHFVVYRSTATDIVPNSSSNGVPQLYVFDRLTSTTTLLTANRFGSAIADNRSLTPIFGGSDGQTLFFESWASDLVSGDFNHNSDILSFTPLFVSIVQGPSGHSVLSWPVSVGETYHVEFKANINDPTWSSAFGSTLIASGRAYFTDSAGALSQRFYRVVAQ